MLNALDFHCLMPLIQCHLTLFSSEIKSKLNCILSLAFISFFTLSHPFLILNALLVFFCPIIFSYYLS